MREWRQMKMLTIRRTSLIPKLVKFGGLFLVFLLAASQQAYSIEITRVSDPVPSSEDREAKNVRVSGDGQSFAYEGESDYDNTGVALFADGVWHIWKTSNVWSSGGVSSDINDLISEATRSDKDAKMVALDYSGERACFSSNYPGEESIMLTNVKDDGNKTITYVTNLSKEGGREALYCDISSDGTTIVFESDAELIPGIPVEKRMYQIYMTQDNGVSFTMITPPELSTVSRNRGASVSKYGSYVAFRSNMQSDTFETPSSSKYEAYLYRTSDGALARITNFKEQECNRTFIYEKMVQMWTKEKLFAEGVYSAGLSSCPYASLQGWIPSAGTTGIGTPNQPKISDDGRFVSYTAGFNAATVRGTKEKYQVIGNPNLYLYDTILDFTWQITKEGEIGASTNIAIENFCCPNAYPSKQRGTCPLKDEMEGLCCWQRPCSTPALHSFISGDGKSIVFSTDLYHASNTTALNKDFDIVHYHIPTSTFTQITDTNNADYDDVLPSVSYNGEIIAFTSSYDYVTKSQISRTNQVFAARVTMGCSRDTEATNYHPSPDIEVCCEFDEDDHVDGIGAPISFRFGGDLSEMLSRVAFPDGNYSSKFCTQYIEDVKTDIACSVAIPKSKLKVIYPMHQCGDWMDDGILIEMEMLQWGSRGSISLREELLSQYSDPNSLLWKGYLTKMLKERDDTPSVFPTSSAPVSTLLTPSVSPSSTSSGTPSLTSHPPSLTSQVSPSYPPSRTLSYPPLTSPVSRPLSPSTNSPLSSSLHPSSIQPNNQGNASNYGYVSSGKVPWITLGSVGASVTIIAALIVMKYGQNKRRLSPTFDNVDGQII